MKEPERRRPPAPPEKPPPALEKRRPPGRIRSFLLAILVHGAFFALIVFGVTWQVSPTAPLIAEIWDKLPPAKPAEPPKPEPAKPEPEPEKKAEPPKPEPPKPDVKPEPPRPDPAIAEKAAREKREKEKREKLEKLEKEKREKLEEKKKQEEAKKKREQEEAAKKKVEDEKRRREEERAKREAEKARAEVAARRQTEVDKYINDIRLKIRSKANIPDTVTGNPEVHLRLRILPGGEVLDATVTKSSGNRAYDAAIERAIRSAQPLPVPPPDSELFPQFRDLNLNIRHER